MNKVLSGTWRNLTLSYWFHFSGIWLWTDLLHMYICFTKNVAFFLIYRDISYCNNKKEESRWDFQSCNLESDRLWHPLLQKDHAALNWYSGRSGLTGGSGEEILLLVSITTELNLMELWKLVDQSMLVFSEWEFREWVVLLFYESLWTTFFFPLVGSDYNNSWGIWVEIHVSYVIQDNQLMLYNMEYQSHWAWSISCVLFSFLGWYSVVGWSCLCCCMFLFLTIYHLSLWGR